MPVRAPAKERPRAPVRHQQGPVVHLIEAVQPAEARGQGLDLVAGTERVDAARLLGRHDPDDQEGAVPGRVDAVGIDPLALKDAGDLGRRARLEEVGRLHPEELVGAVIADVERSLADGGVIGELGAGQRELLAAAVRQVEDPHHVDIRDPEPVALDPDSLGLVEDLSAGAGKELLVQDLSRQRHPADPPLAVLLGRLQLGAELADIEDLGPGVVGHRLREREARGGLLRDHPERLHVLHGRRRSAARASRRERRRQRECHHDCSSHGSHLSLRAICTPPALYHPSGACFVQRGRPHDTPTHSLYALANGGHDRRPRRRRAPQGGGCPPHLRDRRRHLSRRARRPLRRPERGVHQRAPRAGGRLHGRRPRPRDRSPRRLPRHQRSRRHQPPHRGGRRARGPLPGGSAGGRRVPRPSRQGRLPGIRSRRHVSTRHQARLAGDAGRTHSRAAPHRAARGHDRAPRSRPGRDPARRAQRPDAGPRAPGARDVSRHRASAAASGRGGGGGGFPAPGGAAAAPRGRRRHARGSRRPRGPARRAPRAFR